MVESVGKKLNQARAKRGLTIDEAAHATRLRPDKIAALESDDYSRFANNIYAKGFLQIYARFLDVDVSDFARTLDNANPISVGDYQYLSNAPAQRRETTQVRREERKPPSVAPLLFFLFIILCGVGYLGYRSIQSTTDRLEKKRPSEDMSSGPEKTITNTATPEPVAATPAPQPQPQQPQSQPPQALTPAPVVTNAPPASTPAPPSPGRLPVPTTLPNQTPAPTVAVSSPPRTSDQDFVTPTAVPSPDPATHAPPGGVNEVQVAAVKKTWVTVRKDNPKAAPIFEDFIYPNANPLKLKGARFFIEMRGDPTGVQITKNGLPYAYQAGNVPVE